MIKLRKCEICRIEVKVEFVCNFVKGHHNNGFNRLVSKEAILFEKTWFCNDCWKEIMEFDKIRIRGNVNNGF